MTARVAYSKPTRKAVAVHAPVHEGSHVGNWRLDVAEKSLLAGHAAVPKAGHDARRQVVAGRHCP